MANNSNAVPHPDLTPIARHRNPRMPSYPSFCQEWRLCLSHMQFLMSRDIRRQVSAASPTLDPN